MHRVHIADESEAQESADREGPNWVWLVDGERVPERYRDNLNIRHSHLIWPREIWTCTLSHTLWSQSGASSWEREHEDPFLSSLLFCQNMYLPNSHLFFVCFSNYSPSPTSCSPVSPSCSLSFTPPRSRSPVQSHILNIFSISHRLTIHVHTPYLPPPPSRSL